MGRGGSWASRVRSAAPGVVRLSARQRWGGRQSGADSLVLYGPSTMTTTQIEIASARDQWHPQGAYLNTASYGLPPDRAWDAMQAALDDWRGGGTGWGGRGARNGGGGGG